jgi:hypothetical protein
MRYCASQIFILLIQSVSEGATEMGLRLGAEDVGFKAAEL